MTAHRLSLTAIVAGLAGMLVGCSLAPPAGRSESTALSVEQARDTRLGRAVAPLAERHPGQSGIHALPNPRDAFAARVQLARAAERTLDVQYYIWRHDTTGTLMMEALRAAADRGVRVRLLLDDNGIPGLDDALVALDAHPRVEVRLFNPFPFRSFKPLGYLTDFSRVNRRMHNKSFTVDNTATVVGGRNVGDEYFGATDGVLFADLDVLAVGPAAHDVSTTFDAYWRSGSAYPIASLVGAPSADSLAQVQRRAVQVDASAEAVGYAQAVRELPFVQQLVDGVLHLDWAPARLVADDPAKGLAHNEPGQLLITRLAGVVGEPQKSLDLVSPYFVPTKEGTAYFASLAQRGVRVRILTNSLVANDVLAVHSGYAKYRKPLVQAGVQLMELKPNMEGPGESDSRGRGSGAKGGGSGWFGSSGSSLHAKTFGVDGQRAFVGSFNFDPRSARLNTEMGFVIESPLLAAEMGRVFTERLSAHSWQVRVDPVSGALRWVDTAHKPPTELSTEPMASWWQRAAVAVLSWLPIEWLL